MFGPSMARSSPRNKSLSAEAGDTSKSFGPNVQLKFFRSRGLRKRRLPGGMGTEMLRKAKEVVQSEFSNLRSVSISVIFQTDAEELKLNQASLRHNWYTDIITFEIDRTPDQMECELYISLDRAKENARNARILLKQELLHLLIHGLLHLAGFNDHKARDKKRMTEKERFFIQDALPVNTSH